MLVLLSSNSNGTHKQNGVPFAGHRGLRAASYLWPRASFPREFPSTESRKSTMSFVVCTLLSHIHTFTNITSVSSCCAIFDSESESFDGHSECLMRDIRKGARTRGKLICKVFEGAPKCYKSTPNAHTVVYPPRHPHSHPQPRPRPCCCHISLFKQLPESWAQSLQSSEPSLSRRLIRLIPKHDEMKYDGA